MNRQQTRAVRGWWLPIVLGALFSFSTNAQTVAPNGVGRINPPASGVNFKRVRPGDWVAIDGSGLNAVRQVRFGLATATFTGNANRLVAVVPPGATIGPLSLSDSFGDFFSTSFNFQVSPRITSFQRSFPVPTSPVDALRGVPGNTVRIDGENFVDPSDPGFTSVVFFPSSSGGFVQATSELVATATMQVKVPATAVSGPLVVVNPAGDATTVGPFYLQPIVQSMEPARAKIGDTVTLRGTSLLGATSVSFGGIAVVPSQVTSTNVTVVVPTLTQSVTLSVTTPGGTFLTPTPLLLLPRITGFTPAGGPVGAVVTLNGDGLSGTTGVWFGGLAATRFTNVSATQITAVVPSGVPVAPITLTTANGTNTTGTPFFGLPSVTDIVPAQAKPGATITISGLNFSNVSRVRFGGGVEALFTVESPSSISATVPLGAVSGPILVTNPGGESSGGRTFTIQSISPLVLGMVPSSGAPGTAVRIVGDNLSGATGVRFNGVSVPNFTVQGETNILTVVPVGATSGRVLVLTSSGSVQSPANFLVGVDADLRVTGQVLPQEPFAGGETEVSFVVQNLGPLNAGGVGLTVSLPGTTVLEATTSQGVFDLFGTTVTFTVGALPVNGSALVSVRARVGGSAIELVGVAESETTDPDPLNNTLRLSVRPVRPELDVALMANGSVELRWPLVGATWQLEQAEGVAGPWGLVSGTPEGTPTGQRMVLPAAGGSRVFRLRVP
jgi:hypothetical protein